MTTKKIRKAIGVRQFDLRFLMGILVLFLSGACILTSLNEGVITEAGGEKTQQDGIELTLEALQALQTQIAIEQTQLAESDMVTPSVPSPEIPVEVEITVTLAPSFTITPEPTDDTASAETAFREDFSVDSGRFSTSYGMTVESGALYMGKFDQCAQFENNAPAGCVSVCLTCGDQLSEYEVNLEVVFVDGVSERLYGLALRFIDENGNQIIDPEDYFLGWVFSINQAKWFLYEHKADQISPWKRLAKGETNLRPTPRQPNYLRVVAYRDGERIDIYMNDVLVTRVVSTPPMPGERYVENMPESGAIGLWVADRGIRVMYDNYTFTDVPNED